MNRDAAAERLAAMVPGLSDVELERILDDVQGLDSTGVASWSTMSLRIAAREGCRRMAAKAAASFDFTTADASFRRSQEAETWERLAESYGRGINGSTVMHTEQV